MALRGGEKLEDPSIIDKAALKLKKTFSIVQNSILNNYKDGAISILIFENMKEFSTEDDIIRECPPLIELEKSYDIFYLGGRNQILLKLIEEESFSYDIENEGKLIRIVANFKGGGINERSDELKTVELSSHAGIGLGLHTEPPYNCTFKAKNNLSPSPSSLIISAKSNPVLEPTFVVPTLPILKKIGIENTLALTLDYFHFTRSDSFSDNGVEYQQKNVSIIDFDEKQGFSIRYNSYRFTIDENAPSLVKKAYKVFCSIIDEIHPYQHSLTQKSAIIINNYRAMHSRNIIKDNRRILVRVFGTLNKSYSTVLSNNPLVLKG